MSDPTVCQHPFTVATLAGGVLLFQSRRIQMLTRFSNVESEQGAGVVSLMVQAECSVVWWCGECLAWCALPGQKLPPWAEAQAARLDPPA